MKAVREASADSRSVVAPAVSERFGRLRGWLADPAVRVALVATLGLRVALSAVAAILVLAQQDTYTAVIQQISLHGRDTGIAIYPVPLRGIEAYLVGPWLRWDANNYLNIAATGYSFSSSTAFLPLYPLLIRVVSVPLGGNLPISALLISTVATFVMFMLLYRLIIRLTGSDAAAQYGVVVACLLPLSFFFMAPYTESLFLALSLGTILASLSGRWCIAAILAALASLTRQQGMLLSVLALPAIGAELEEFWKSHDFCLAQIRIVPGRLIAPSRLVLAPLAAYGVWIGFIHWGLRQGVPWQELTTSSLWKQTFVWPGIGVIVDIGHLLLQPGDMLLYHPDLVLDAVCSVAAAVGIGMAWRRLPPGLLLYLVGGWCLAVVKVETIEVTTGAARYLLALLPLCLIPGEWLAKARPYVKVLAAMSAVVIISLILSRWVLWTWIN